METAAAAATNQQLADKIVVAQDLVHFLDKLQKDARQKTDTNFQQELAAIQKCEELFSKVSKETMNEEYNYWVRSYLKLQTQISEIANTSVQTAKPPVNSEVAGPSTGVATATAPEEAFLISQLNAILSSDQFDWTEELLRNLGIADMSIEWHQLKHQITNEIASSSPSSRLSQTGNARSSEAIPSPMHYSVAELYKSTEKTIQDRDKINKELEKIQQEITNAQQGQWH